MDLSLLSRRTPLEVSLLLLTAVVLFALVGLAVDGNWPKLVRVATAFSAYTIVLWSVARMRRVPSIVGFVAAGGAAGLVSAFVRPDPMPLNFLIAQIAGAALLLGPLHWLALRHHRSTQAPAAQHH